MKKSLALLILISLFYSFNSYSQETFKKNHIIKNKLIFEVQNSGDDGKKNSLKNAENETCLVKDSYESFLLLPDKDDRRIKIEKQLSDVSNNLRYSAKFINLEGDTIIITEKQANKDGIEKTIGYNKTATPDFFEACSTCKYRGDILFKESKLFVNLWNFTKDTYKDDEKALYYTLKDGQTAKIDFYEFTAASLIIPIKYRPKDGDNDIDDSFTTAFNVAVFLGGTIGQSNFHYRKKIGNKTITHKNSFGIFLGTAAETLNASNTDDSANAPTDSETRTIGLFSTGLGYVYSRNKLAIGAFVGWDFGVGSISNTWDYDGRPWIGIGLGYDIFKL